MTTVENFPPLVEPTLEHEPLHWFVYADPGRMKSTFAATFPKPLLVLAFDSWSKMAPYRRRGKPGPSFYDHGTPIEFVMSTHEPDKAIIQIEQYFDDDIYDPKRIYAWERFQTRLASLHAETEEKIWSTVVLDSVSSLEFCVRKFQEFKQNPLSSKGNKQDGRQWYASSGSSLQEVCYNLGWLRNTNVVVLAHVRFEKDRVREMVYWQPEMPGTYSRRVPGLFSEIYTVHFDPEAQGGNKFWLQTENDGTYIAATQIPAPSGIAPHYNELWLNYDEGEKD